MKKMLLITASAFTLFAQAQTKEGRVIYERTIQLPVRSFGNIPDDVRAQLPKSRTDQFELLFTAEHALWQYLPNASNEDPGTFGGGNVMIRMGGGSNEVTYADFATRTRTDQREAFDKSFLVTDSLSKSEWKLSDETKTILNFTAHKATTARVVARPKISMENGAMKREMVNDTVAVVAWYTTDIPVSAGPDWTSQLPGLTLELDMNKGQTVIKALEFSSKVAANKIKPPRGGKKVTNAEFQKEMETMMEEMRKNGGGRNVIRMQ